MISFQLPATIAELRAPLLYLTTIFAFALGPQRQTLRVTITLPIVLILSVQGLYYSQVKWGEEYGQNCFILCIDLMYVVWILLSCPDKEQWHKIQYGPKKKEANGAINGNNNVRNAGVAVSQTFWSRAWLGIRLATTNRYVGWSCQSKNVVMEVDSDYPKMLFLVRKSARALWFYFLKDIIYAYTASGPHGTWDDMRHLKPVADFAGYGFWHRFWWTWVYIILTYVTMDFLVAAYGIVSVASGLANPRDCPSFFGDLRGLYTLRNAWSSVWHQGMRRVYSSPSIFIVRDVLQIPKGTFASKYLQLFLCFGLSGVVHGSPSMLLHGSMNDDGAHAFFVGQALIIMVEDHVISLGKSLGLQDSMFWRTIGFIWTVFIVGFTLQFWTSRLLGSGLWIHGRGHDFLGIGPQV